MTNRSITPVSVVTASIVRRVRTNRPRLRPLLARIRGAGLALVRQLAKFGVVGLLAYVVDVGLFNLLTYVGDPPLLSGQPLAAKAVSASVATVVAWLGNRFWTFRRTRRADVGREFVLYAIMCTIGLGISLACLWVSHYALGFTSALADNVAANVIGLAAGTAFRFWAYKRYVFTHSAPTDHGSTTIGSLRAGVATHVAAGPSSTS